MPGPRARRRMRRHGMSACVFVGPTLPIAEAAAVSRRHLPAAGGARRRLPRRVAPRPRAIGIVDGYFQWAPAVWHKEILWAIGQGVHVFGAASMGALRAAELAPFGMRGVGRIFEAYRDGSLGRRQPFEDDDEVAVVHGPPESGYLGAVRGDGEHPLHAGPGGARRRDRRGDAALPRGDRQGRPSSPIAAMRLSLRGGRAAGLPAAEIAALERWLPSGRVRPEAPRRGGHARGDARLHRRDPAAGPAEVHLRAHDVVAARVSRRGRRRSTIRRKRRCLASCASIAPAARRCGARRCIPVGNGGITSQRVDASSGQSPDGRSERATPRTGGASCRHAPIAGRDPGHPCRAPDIGAPSRVG